MALMNCPECGKQISDKAYSCPGCGVKTYEPCEESVIQYLRENIVIYNGKEINLYEVADIYGSSKSGAIKFISRTYGVPEGIATNMIDKYYSSIMNRKELTSISGEQYDVGNVQEVFLKLKKKGYIEIKNGVLTFKNGIGLCYCPSAPITEYILLYGGKDKRGNIQIVINNNRMDSPKFIEVVSKSEYYKDAEILLESLNKNAIIDNQKSIWKALSYKSGVQRSRDKRISDDFKQQKQEEKSIKQQQELTSAQTIFYNSQVKCPKCKSTSIQYSNKKLSLGRGIVGGLIGSAVSPLGTAVGITVGGLSSKKGYAVCLNCGKQWKI